tara:strand:- start:438 stop:611 length:174 start_codon:yes stop_codon:yes gene_type:complete
MSVDQIKAISNAMYAVATAQSTLDQLRAQQNLNDTLLPELLKQQGEEQAHESDQSHS